MVHVVKTTLKAKSNVIINTVDKFVPAGLSLVVNSADIEVNEYGYGCILVSAGTETGTATLDVKYQVKGTDGVYYDHTSATQITGAGSALTKITALDGITGRIVVTIVGSSEADGYADVYVEFITKTR